MDLVVELLKNTYLLRTDKIEKTMEGMWKKYQKILDSAKDIETLWEGRVYLYVLGYYYPEDFGIKAIERRLNYLHKPISMLDFLDTIDKNRVTKEQRADLLFAKLEKLYNLIKKYKQLVKNRSYLDEKRFNEKQQKILGKKSKEEIAVGL